MPNYNSVTLIGHLGQDPELKTTKSGLSVCEVGLAINNKRKEGDEWKTDTIWLDLTFWNKTAENLCQYCHKGSCILVEGRLTEDRWTAKDGSKRSKIKVTVSQMQFLDSKEKGGGKAEASAAQQAPDVREAGADVEDSSIPF